LYNNTLRLESISYRNTNDQIKNVGFNGFYVVCVVFMRMLGFDFLHQARKIRCASPNRGSVLTEKDSVIDKTNGRIVPKEYTA